MQFRLSVHIKDFKSFAGEHRIGPLSKLTAVIGPNGSGKSNFIDAIAFALCLPMVPSKHKHTRELLHRAGAPETGAEASDPVELSVQLTFHGFALKRSFNGKVHEHTYIENGREHPLTSFEYKKKV